MKIKNELVSLKIGNKQYDLKNLILDEYLKKVITTQLTVNPVGEASRFQLKDYSILMGALFFKFDTPFENLQGNTELYTKDFDIYFIGGQKNDVSSEISQNQIAVKYSYDLSQDRVYDYQKHTRPISEYYGRKITAIGFGTDWHPKSKVMAVLDTSNYNIYMQANQNLECTRRDIFISDALFWSNDDRIKGPVHLSPNGGKSLLYQDPYKGIEEIDDMYKKNGAFAISPGRTFGILYSIGLSSYTDYIDKEFVIGKDVNVVRNGTEISIQSINNDYNFEKELHPNNLIYPSSILYPIKSNYKYIIFKYKVYQELVVGDAEINGSYMSFSYEYTPTDTKSYYHQAIPINKFGESNLKIKYERG